MPGNSRDVILFRMVTETHVCPHGLKALALLRREGFTVADRPLKTRAAIDAFKAEHRVATTPQVFIDSLRIGGYDALQAFLGKPAPDPKAPSYRPVVAVFGIAALMAVAAGVAVGTVLSMRTIEWFAAISMCILAVLKLRDIERFTSMFLGYDLLARRVPRYAYAYPFAEAAAGLLMLSGSFAWVAIPIALFIGGIGAVSVFKAVYIDGRDLKCACVGGDSNVPLGFASLAETG